MEWASKRPFLLFVVWAVLGVRFGAWAASGLGAWAVSGLYSQNSDVNVLNAEKYFRLQKMGVPFIVQFFSSGCGHCKTFVPEYEKAAKALEKVIKVVAVGQKAAMVKENVSGFPTVMFGVGESLRTGFSGNRTAVALIDFAAKELAAFAKQQLPKPKESGNAGGGEQKKSFDTHSDKHVITLTDENFKKLVVKEGAADVWFVVFYALWCTNCRTMMPDWKRAAAALQGKVKVAQVQGQEQSKLAGHFRIEFFPTILLFPPGNRTLASLKIVAVPYDGERNLVGFVEFAKQFTADAPTAQQLTDPEQFEQCAKGVCLIAFLPHIMDSSAKARNDYLKIYNAVLRASYSMPVKFFWSEGGEQYEFEEMLRLQFGFPAVVAVNMEKNRYATYKGSFQEETLRAFITSLISGKPSTDQLPETMAKINKVASWDGKDAPPPAEDDEL